MKTKRWVLAIVLGMILACNKDDSANAPKLDPFKQPDPEFENNAPAAFSLLTPEADSDREILLPTFAWEAAADPDGDVVMYDLYIDTANGPQTPIATGLSETTFVPAANLELFATYYWKVVAFDRNGAEMASTVQKFEVRPRLFVTKFVIQDDETRIFNYNKNGQLTTYILNRDNGGPDRSTSYFYNTEDRLISRIRAKNADIYTYDNEDRLIRIESENFDSRYEIGYNAKSQIHNIDRFANDDDTVGELVMQYSVEGSSPTGYLFTEKQKTASGNFEIISETKSAFEWDDSNNMTSYLIQIDKQDGNGFVVAESSKFVYDNNPSPWYSILEDKFGFNTLSVHSLRGIDAFYFANLLRWMSANNLKERSVDLGVGKFDYVYDYTYNEEGYPISAELTVKSTYPGADPISMSNYSWEYQP